MLNLYKNEDTIYLIPAISFWYDTSYYTNKRAIDVGCMLHDYKPISYTQVIEKLSQVVLPTLTIKV
jgi:predicted glycosyltransferase